MYDQWVAAMFLCQRVHPPLPLPLPSPKNAQVVVEQGGGGKAMTPTPPPGPYTTPQPTSLLCSYILLTVVLLTMVS